MPYENEMPPHRDQNVCNAKTTRICHTHNDLREGTHFHDVLELLVHVPNGELAVLDLLQQLLVVVQLQFVHLVDQALDVAHAQQLADERLRLERLQIVDVLTGADENDGRIGRCHTAPHRATD